MHDSLFAPPPIAPVRFTRRETDIRERAQRRDTAQRRQQRTVADTLLTYLAADVRRRLRPSCKEWDDAEFEGLVLHIARMKVRWAAAGPLD